MPTQENRDLILPHLLCAQWFSSYRRERTQGVSISKGIRQELAAAFDSDR